MQLSSRRRLTALIVATGMAGLIALPAVAAAPAVAAPTSKPAGSSQSQQESPFRTIVTADLSAYNTDDTASVYRLLTYSNDLGDGLKGLIYSSSFLRFTGNPPTRGYDTTLFQRVIGEYDAVYENFKLHDPRYPTPEHLLSLVRVGNISAAGEFATDSPGSLLIKEELLSDDPRPLFLQMWGGTNTVAAALRSIKAEYENTPEWPEIRQRVINKASLYIILDQDVVYKTYIKTNWPDLKVVMNREQFFALAYPNARAPRLPAELNKYLGPDYMSKIKQGPFLGNLPTATTPTGQPTCLCEGDSPAFLGLIDTGLRSTEDPSYGGWGGRFDQYNANTWADWPAYIESPTINSPGRQLTTPQTAPDLTRDASPWGDPYDVYYPQSRWIPAMQNDYAARSEWQYKSFEDANHAPVVSAPAGKLDVSVKPGQQVQLTGHASDPDGDQLTGKWWQYREAGTYTGSVRIDESKSVGTFSGSFRVPADAQVGDTIHAVLEVIDNGEIPLTRYQRVIVTVR